MQFGTIASGSSGNCLYIGNEEQHFLIDAGVTAKRICQGLDTYQITPDQLNGIFITHEHIDHIKGLGVLLRKYEIPVYATKGTIRGIKSTKSLGAVPDHVFHEITGNEYIQFDDCIVKSFRISHDAAEPVSYTITNGNQKIGMVTDIGFYDDHIVENLSDSDLLYVEANHDIHMLEVGPYPYYLKQRILSNRGHLCNEMAGKLVKELMTDRLKKVILGHLSKENNFPELAHQAVCLEAGLLGPVQMNLFEMEEKNTLTANDVSVAPRDCVSNLFTIK